MILVTGAGGTVGTQLVKVLRTSGAQFRAAYHSPLKAEQAKRDGLDAVSVDFATPSTLAAALADVERLFLLGTGFLGQSEAETGVVRAARKAGVRHVVKLSVWGAETEAFS